MTSTYLDTPSLKALRARVWIAASPSPFGLRRFLAMTWVRGQEKLPFVHKSTFAEIT